MPRPHGARLCHHRQRALPIEAETTAALVRRRAERHLPDRARAQISRPAVLKLLDVGVQGLIVPNVKTLDQVRSLVDYAKYYPIGQRGFCPSRKDGWGFDGSAPCRRPCVTSTATLLFPQCETAEALDIIEDICAVDGWTASSSGRSTVDLDGHTAVRAPEFQAAVARIVAAAAQPESTVCSSPARPTAWLTASARALTPWPTVLTPHCSFRA
ncbi:MAG: aldolase/citrate lyase family protein [Oscillospiraceae bacterium]